MEKKPKAYFFMGTNGSGKSSIRDYIPLQNSFVVIDPDKIARDYDYKINELQVGRKAISMFRECLQNQLSFAMETTLGGLSAINRIREVKENGYAIYGYYIGLESSQENIKRVESRVKNGGHDIPHEKIIKRFEESRDNLIKASPFFDKLEIIDNTIKFDLALTFENQKLVFKNQRTKEWTNSIGNKIETYLATLP